MEPVPFANVGHRTIKIGFASLLTLTALVGLAGTDAGKRFFAQIGVADSVAQTTDAANRTAYSASNALKSFIGRSPGERGATDALKGKQKRALASAGNPRSGPKPTQRALGKIFDKPVNALVGTPESIFGPPPVDVLAGTEPLLALASPLPTTPAIFSPVVGGGFIGGGIGSGGGGVGGGSSGGGPGDGPGVVPPPVIPVASAVPEPSTWMLLLIGFGAIGAIIRRTKIAGSGRAGNCVAR